MVSLVLIWDLFVLNMFSRVLVSVPLCTHTRLTVKQPLIKLLEIICLKYTGFREFTVYCLLHLSAEGVLCAIWILTSLLRKTPGWQHVLENCSWGHTKHDGAVTVLQQQLVNLCCQEKICWLKLLFNPKNSESQELFKRTKKFIGLFIVSVFRMLGQYLIKIWNMKCGT